MAQFFSQPATGQPNAAPASSPPATAAAPAANPAAPAASAAAPLAPDAHPDLFGPFDSPLPTVQFSASSYTGSETSPSVQIAVTLSSPSAQTVTVHYSTANGTALAGTDSQTTQGTLTITPGNTSGLFTVPLLDDNLPGEPSPATVALSLSSPTNATLGNPSSATLNITEDNDPTVQLSQSSYSTTEGNKQLTITATLSTTSNQEVTVPYSTSASNNDTAIAGTDFTAASGNLMFAPGTTSANFKVTLLDDNQPDEPSAATFHVGLGTPSGATLGSPSSAVVTVSEDSDRSTTPAADVPTGACNCGCPNESGSLNY